MTSLPLSVLDLVPIAANTRASDALRRSVELAQLAESLGFARLWYAEHHGMPSVASAAPEILIGHAAAHTQTLRLGSGGVMLPNHAPLRVAEAFRTLAALHPGRIDLGLGRAPGSDVHSTQALRAFDGEMFPALLQELLTWSGLAELPPDHPLRSVRAMPDDTPLPPIWILGSSGASARLAGRAGLGYSFASHFSSAPAGPAFDAYRSAFQPSAQFTEPHAILGVAAICAASGAEAEHLATAADLAWVRIRRGQFLPLPSPEDAARHVYSEAEQRLVHDFRRLVIVGDPQHVKSEIVARAKAAGASEVMIASNIADHATRLRSFQLIAQAFGMAHASRSFGTNISTPVGETMQLPEPQTS